MCTATRHAPFRRTRWPWCWCWRKSWWLVGDRSLPVAQRSFAYMPCMHSESALVHAQAVTLFSQPGMEDTLRFELRHKEIIYRFSPYPHRNTLLGRTSTPEDLTFLSEPGSSF